MSTIEERTAERERQLADKISQQRRQAHPKEYLYCKSEEKFIDILDGTFHTEKAVDASIPFEYWRVEVIEPDGADDGAAKRGRPAKRKEKLIRPSIDVMRIENDQFVETMTWAPGRPQIIKDLMPTEGGLIPSAGRRVFNNYKPAPKPNGDHEAALPWIELIKKLWPNPEEHDYFLDYCAHMVQRPEEKCNAAIVLSGSQRIGKDSVLAPVRAAIGLQNAKNIDPDDLFDLNNPWIETLMLTVDEVRPTKDDYTASALYNRLKPMIAAPPEMLPCKNKYDKMRYVVNVLRVFITTNDYMSMFIPPEDGRMFIMHSNLPKEWHIGEAKPDYFRELWRWFEEGGAANVAAFLAARDINRFEPKGQVKRTVGWSVIANSWDANDDAIGAAIARLGSPDVVFGADLLAGEFDGREEIANILKSSRKAAHRMQQEGYFPVKPLDGSARWRFNHDGKNLETRVAFVKAKILHGDALLKTINKFAIESLKKGKQNNIYTLKKDEF
jgi:hypothetical protein